ncbi:MAG: hypothetical protein ACLFVH_05890 [Phycisphaerae bacterium]
MSDNLPDAGKTPGQELPDPYWLTLNTLPPVDMRHVLVLTDDTGILQHATCSTPNPHHGYCTDDNARSLIAGCLYCALRLPGAHEADPAKVHHDVVVAMQRYLSFLIYAFNPETGRLRNFMNYDRSWAEQVGSEAAHARAIWGLGLAARRAPLNDMRELADRIFRRALEATRDFEHFHAWAYTLLGLDEYLTGDNADQADARCIEIRAELARRLLDTHKENASDDWPWWYNTLTWGNAKPPEALIRTGHATGNEEMLDIGLRSLRWVLDAQTGQDGQLRIIGNRGWYPRDGQPALYDQQPLEAQGLVQATMAAYRATDDNTWIDEALRCLAWFYGRNDGGVAMYNPETGGCHDGLRAEGPDPNQGAESTLACVLSVLELHAFNRHLSPRN